MLDAYLQNVYKKKKKEDKNYICEIHWYNIIKFGKKRYFNLYKITFLYIPNRAWCIQHV